MTLGSKKSGVLIGAGMVLRNSNHALSPPVELLCSGVWHLCLRWVRREELAARGRVTGVARCDEGDWKA